MAEAGSAKKKKKQPQPPTEQPSCEREGKNLLGSPSYTELSNGRFKCVETGHELPAKEMESYGQSKKCRLGLIEFALKNKKPPLNMFKRDPNNSSKLICKLTGDVVNKSEEHIWKHLNGKRFSNRLEQKEMGKLEPNGVKVNGDGDEKMSGKENEESDEKKKKKKKKKKKRKKKKDKKKKKKLKEVQMEGDEEMPEGAEVAEKSKESEEIDFWVPPVGSRWDNDEGGGRWGSDSESEEENGEDDGDEEADDIGELIEPLELIRTKRASDGIALEPSSGTSRKKKKKLAEPAQ